MGVPCPVSIPGVTRVLRTLVLAPLHPEASHLLAPAAHQVRNDTQSPPSLPSPARTDHRAAFSLDVHGAFWLELQCISGRRLNSPFPAWCVRPCDQPVLLLEKCSIEINPALMPSRVARGAQEKGELPHTHPPTAEKLPWAA